MTAASSYETYTTSLLVTGSEPVVTEPDTIGSGQTLAANTVMGRVSETRATKTTGVVGNNNAILWSANLRGTAGNTVTVALVDPSANNAALSVSVSGTAITVHLATGGTGSITSTAAQVIAAIAASAAASALVDVANASTSTGAAAVVAAAAAALTGGADNGHLKAHDPEATDGTQTAVGILVHAVDTTSAAQEAPIYIGGTFNPDLLVWHDTLQTDSQRAAVFDRTPINLRTPT